MSEREPSIPGANPPEQGEHSFPLETAPAATALREALVAKERAEAEVRHLQAKLVAAEQLAEEMLFEKNQAVRVLRAERDLMPGKLRAERDRLQEELTIVYESNAWRLVNQYWGLRRNVQATAQKHYGSLRAILAALRLPELEPAAWRERIRRLLRWENEAASWQNTKALVAAATRGSLPPRYDLICFPVINWDFRFQRPQQMMTRFAAAGHRVFYLNQHFHQRDEAYLLRAKAPNIYEVSLRGKYLNIYKDSLDEEACGLLFDSLDALRRDLVLGATLAWVQLPCWWPLTERLRAAFNWPVVYDCMDYHAGFSTNQPQMLKAEADLLAGADHVVVSSARLQEQVATHTARSTLVRNGCDYQHFARTQNRPSGKRPVIGYYGAIADWFDADLVADLAERRPDWDFILVGSTYLADLTRLKRLKNVSLTGEKPYAELPEWLSKFAVTFIPFKLNPLTEATNPVKAYEILAAGKPLVSVPLPELAALGGLVRLAATVEAFEREISAALREDSLSLVEQRRAFAREHTWEQRVETLAPVVSQTFPLASIIIVTYNNLELNKLCLESLYERTEWPNFEVIVVDNASTDGTPAYLKEVEQRFPRLKVVLNDSNLGFAAANNIGLRLAGGEYLALLNNDTVVTRGWLSALIRHLSADRKLGLIGPVTNAIANQARIPVGYQELDRMPGWALRYTREHDGQVVPIPMLAMFCVVMRRRLFEQIGLLDERFGIGMFEDDDYCRRVELAGFKLGCAHDSFIHHWQRSSFRLLGEDEYLRIYAENRRKYAEKWRESAQPVIELEKHPVPQRLFRDDLASKGTLIFLPSIGWDIQLFQRPHHLARAFAQRGYRVFFDCSNSSNDKLEGIKEIEPRLYLFRGVLAQLVELPDDAILWTFTGNYHQHSAFPSTMQVIYDWIDDLEIFPYDPQLLRANHERALNAATVVTSVARRLHEQALAVRSDALYLPNGVENWRFADDLAPCPNDSKFASLLQQGKPIAGYYGALAKWFDYDLLAEVARQCPDWNFVLIGPNHDQSINGHPILSQPNLEWLGPRDYQTLAGYLNCFTVAMIPFVINNITLATSPLKLYEYFAGGKPVVTTPMPECQAYPEVNIAQTAREFARALEHARAQGQDAAFRERLRQLARENSWVARVNTLVGRLRQAAGAAATAHL